MFTAPLYGPSDTILILVSTTKQTLDVNTYNIGAKLRVSCNYVNNTARFVYGQAATHFQIGTD